MACWGTAGLLKLYLVEPDPASYRAHVAAGSLVATSGLARLEFFTAARRKEPIGDIRIGGASQAAGERNPDLATGGVRSAQADLPVACQIESVVDRCYRQTPAIPIRTFDAVHLATALVLGEWELVTTDTRMRDATVLHGLAVFPP